MSKEPELESNVDPNEAYYAAENVLEILGALQHNVITKIEEFKTLITSHREELRKGTVKPTLQLVQNPNTEPEEDSTL